MNPQHSICWIVIACAVSVTSRVWATTYTLATDNAANPPYSFEAGGAWKGVDPGLGENPPGSDNGGFGFRPWDFSGGFHQPEFSPYGVLNHFMDGVDFAASSFNNLGSPAFGLTNANLAFNGDTARATRISTAPLQVGDAIILDFDNPELDQLDPFSPAGMLIRLNTGGGPVTAGDPSVTERFGLFATSDFNSSDWAITEAGGFVDSRVDSRDTTGGSEFRFALTGNETYSFELVRLSDNQTLFARAGALANAGAGPIDSIEITIFANGSGNGLNGAAGIPTGEREFFFNNLRVETSRVPGDYSSNGIVDVADYIIWRKTFGQPVVPGTAADGDRNGIIGPPDYNIWKMHFGQSGSMAAASTKAVPEPSRLAEICLGFLLLRPLRRRTASPATKSPHHDS